MFNEDEDWSDEPDTRTQSGSVCKAAGKVNNSGNVKPKLVGKKSLLRTLQTLGSIPEWKNTDHQQDSESDAGAAPSPTKRKKKRRKKRRHSKASEEEPPQENGDVDQSVEEKKPAAKKKINKVVAKKLKTTSAAEGNDKETTKPAKIDVNKPDDGEKLSRKQWKNKVKNKKKCKNKYRQKTEEEGENGTDSADKHKPEGEGKTDSCISKNSDRSTETAGPQQKRDTQRKPQKRKQTDEDAAASCAPENPKEEKQRIEKHNNTNGGSEHAKITDQLQPLPMKRLKPELSKEQILKRKKMLKMLRIKEPEQRESPAEQKEEPAPEPEVKLDRSASLRLRMEQRLESARFRYINEVLYSTSSGDAKRMFTQDPQAFWIYHRGYTAQVQRWPANPVDAIISWIQLKSPSLVVADFGCGDCKVARSVRNKVHSFDLAAACELVTVCDMAHVPLRDGSVDIAVFCLSLMGTNLADFLAEANRVLKMGGLLKIAEVASRFDNVRSFLTALANMGFRMVSKDTENTHFYAFECVKSGNAPESVKKFGLELKPCLYKKR